MTTLLKFIHLAMIAVWSAGLIVLPLLFWQRRSVETEGELDQLHRLTRFVYVEITSPAAFDDPAFEERAGGSRGVFWYGGFS